MSSQYPTLPTNQPPDLASVPAPPAHLFRVVKRISASTYLCLPRVLDPPGTPPSFQVPTAIAGFRSLNTTWAYQQIYLMEHSAADCLVWAVDRNGTSLLQQKYVDMLPQLLIVKMGLKEVRQEGEMLELLHRQGDDVSLHIGSLPIRAQLTASPSSTWLCLAPVFGPTLQEFGEAIAAEGGMAGWFLAHVCLELLDSVEYVHTNCISHNRISSDSVRLNLYPSYRHHRYRGYPDVQLVDFGAATPSEDTREDAKEVLWIMEDLISKWSDCAPFLKHMAKQGEEGEWVSDDPVLLLLRDVRSLLLSRWTGTLDEVGSHFYACLIDLRRAGPEQIPRHLAELLHSDLATDAEVEHALREPTVIKFDARHEAFVKIVAKEPVVMGSGGHAGMKTGQIMVMRFTKQKAGFLRIVGEDYSEDEGSVEMDEGSDADGEYETEDEIEVEFGGSGGGFGGN